jgi:Skp family chaperone for outer membrane proteins
MRIYLVGIVLFIASGLALAQEQPLVSGSHIGIVRMEVLSEESLLAKDIQRQLQYFRTRQQQRITLREEQLKRQDRTLMQTAGSHSDTNNQKIHAFRAEVEQLHRDMQQQRNALDKAYGKAMKALDLAIINSVTQVAKRRHLDMVMQAKHTIYVAPAHDITEESLREMNRNYSHYVLELKVP